MKVQMAKPLNWDTLASSCEGHPELTSAEQEQAIAAFIFLKGALGSRLFHVQLGFYHPLRLIFLNDAGWVKKWAVRLATMLKRFERDSQFKRLVAAMKKPDLFPERLAVLEFAEMLHGSEFNVSLEPEVEISGTVKRPDLLVTSPAPGDSFYLETSDLQTSAKSRAAAASFEPIVDALMQHTHDLDYAGAVKRALNEEELRTVRMEMNAVIDASTRENRFVPYTFLDAVELGFAPRDQITELVSWCGARGYEPRSVGGPPEPDDEVHRLRLKIADKQKQLPGTHSNVIAINSEPKFALAVGPDRFHVLKAALREELARFQQIELVLVCVRWGGAFKDAEIFEDGCYSINRLSGEFIGTNIVVITNKACARPWHPETGRSFIQALSDSAVR